MPQPKPGSIATAGVTLQVKLGPKIANSAKLRELSEHVNLAGSDACGLRAQHATRGHHQRRDFEV